jgi:hypothetical protein
MASFLIERNRRGLRIDGASGLRGGIWEVSECFGQVAEFIAFSFERRFWALGRWFFAGCVVSDPCACVRADLSGRCQCLLLGDIGREFYGFFIKLTRTSLVGATFGLGLGKASLVVLKSALEFFHLLA